MAFRITYKALREMVGRIALNTSFARSIVRKSGLRPGTATTGPRTIIDGYINTEEAALLRQWSTDFTGFAGVRFANRAEAEIYVFYSHTLDGSYDPGDWALLMGDDATPVFASRDNLSGDLRWFVLPAERRAPIRLTLSTSGDGVEGTNSVASYSAMLQVR